MVTLFVQQGKSRAFSLAETKAGRKKRRRENESIRSGEPREGQEAKRRSDARGNLTPEASWAWRHPEGAGYVEDGWQRGGERRLKVLVGVGGARGRHARRAPSLYERVSTRESRNRTREKILPFCEARIHITHTQTRCPKDWVTSVSPYVATLLLNPTSETVSTHFFLQLCSQWENYNSIQISQWDFIIGSLYFFSYNFSFITLSHWTIQILPPIISDLIGQ